MVIGDCDCATKVVMKEDAGFEDGLSPMKALLMVIPCGHSLVFHFVFFSCFDHLHRHMTLLESLPIGVLHHVRDYLPFGEAMAMMLISRKYRQCLGRQFVSISSSLESDCFPFTTGLDLSHCEINSRALHDFAEESEQWHTIRGILVRQLGHPHLHIHLHPYLHLHLHLHHPTIAPPSPSLSPSPSPNIPYYKARDITISKEMMAAVSRFDRLEILDLSESTYQGPFEMSPRPGKPK